ncbi:hypothetical protein ASB57_15965 [Bordetella sp. N]|nr:hypothetical protein ASB57_15965 [Bordetella sp. N]
MDYTGFLDRFYNNRPLSQWDREHQLKQKQRLDVKLRSELSVVKMNSTYLLLVDRWYEIRGFLAAVALLVVVVFLYFFARVFWMLVTGQLADMTGFWFSVAVLIAAFVVIVLGGLWVACKELFRWTHYPIALDRQRKMVHVFRLDGTVLTVPWNKVFFTLGRGHTMSSRGGGASTFDVRGLVLDTDRLTVRETFAFSVVGLTEAEAVAHWEFLRRYMEEGPEAVMQQVKFCMPLDGQREPAGFSFQRVFFYGGTAPALLWLFSLPFDLLHAVGRVLVMKTSRIPQWPAEVAATLTVEDGDPYVRDASMNPPDLQ